MTTMSGSTENATSASRQSIASSTIMMPGQREDVAEHRHHARREQVVQRVDVRRHPRHQPADRVAVVVGHVEALEVPVDLRPEVEHDALPGVLQHIGLHELQREGRQQDAEEQERDAVHARPGRSSAM